MIGVEVQVHSNAATAGRAAADDVITHLRATLELSGVASAMFATGASQVDLLAELAARRDEIDWTRVVVFHMDEYVGVGGDDPDSLARYIRQRITEPLDPGAVYYLDGSADPDAEARRYANLLLAHPIDVCVLGVGVNGHLAFNEPSAADFDDPATVKVVELEDGSPATRAVTVTIPALLAAERVVVVATEERKADVVRRALRDPVSTQCPASILQTQAHATLHLDRGSAALL